MIRYALSRVVQAIPTLIGMSILIFLLVRLLPGDVSTSLAGAEGSGSEAQREELLKSFGLTEPLPVQYWHFVSGFFTGAMGKSFLSGYPVTQILANAVPITLEITFLAVLFAVVVGIPLGVLSAVKRNSAWDVVIRVAGLFGLSMPSFWFAILALLFTSTVFSWVPSVTWIPFWQDPLGNLGQMALPALAVSLALLAGIMRMTRTSMLDVLGDDYVRTARAKGANATRVVMRHALRNALIPVVTLTGAEIGSLMGGTTVIEVVFGLPGVGNTLVQATYLRDYPIVQTTAMFLAVVFIVLNILVDLLYKALDPRIEFSS
jgi:peptide/nickel transport system permease protein